MAYELAKLPIHTLLKPVSDASSALARLDERIARSAVGGGWLERHNFTDACASLWIDGELVNLEDLVLHDATRDIRTPTHELTIARDVLRTRRRIASQKPGWPLSEEGLRGLRRTSPGQAWPAASLGEAGAGVAKEAEADEVADGAGEGEVGDDGHDGASAFDAELAACCGRQTICRRCFGPSSPSMPGTSFPFSSTRPGSAGCWPPPSCVRPASPPKVIWPPLTSA